MNTRKNIIRNEETELNNIKIGDVDSFIRYMPDIVERLSHHTGMCPKVDSEGQSECSFAEDLYAEKDELAEEVELELKKLPKFIELVDNDIAKYRKNLEQFRMDSNALHLDQAKEKYSDSIHGCEYQIQQYQQRRNTLIEIGSNAEKALSSARKKEWPRGKPQKSFHPVANIDNRRTEFQNGFHGPAKIVGPPGRHSFESEINDLMDFGPIDVSKTK